MPDLNSITPSTQLNGDDITKLGAQLQQQSYSAAAQQMKTSSDQLLMQTLNAKTTATVNTANSAKSINDKVQV